MLKKLDLRKLTLCVLTALILVGANAWFLQANLFNVLNHQQEIEKRDQLILNLELLVSQLKDIETGQRGYTISGNESFLDPFRTGREKVRQQLSALKQGDLVDARLASQLEGMTGKINEAVAWQEETVRLRREGDAEAAAERVRTAEGKQLMDALRVHVDEIIADQRRALAVSTAATENARRRLLGAYAAGIAVTFLLILLTYLLMRRAMIRQYEETRRLERDNWLKDGQAGLGNQIRGVISMPQLAEKSLDFLSRHLGVDVGAFYSRDGDYIGLLALLAADNKEVVPQGFAVGRTLVGDAVRQGRLLHLKELPENYLRVRSSLGEAAPRELAILPVAHEGEIHGVMELGKLGKFSELDLEFLASVEIAVGSALSTARARNRLQNLLEETKRQAEELQVQQEELQSSNEELESQTQALEMQRLAADERNQQLERSRVLLSEKALELQEASRYKSEFLANMSHELRTPLNSLLILATLLAEDKEGSLSDKHREFARTIHKTGTDLLELINDILDLSKVEAGKLELNRGHLSLQALSADLSRSFEPLAKAKGLELSVAIDEEAPEAIWSDRQRVEQILRNLIANAVKFTAQGSVAVGFKVTPAGDGAEELVIAVSDTGIGIPKAKQSVIFDAFQQADGSTSRAYGGTGLGLTISRQLSRLLGGRISLESAEGEGSTFRLHLPLRPSADSSAMPLAMTEPESRTAERSSVADDPRGPGRSSSDAEATKVEAGGTASLLSGDLESTRDPKSRVVLIVEDDSTFAATLALVAREAGYKAVIAGNAASALSFAAQSPPVAVLLDIRLPDLSGYVVLERMKANPRTRHVPVHVISGVDGLNNALGMGAVGVLTKPVRKDHLIQVFGRIEQALATRVRRILLVEDDLTQRQAISELLGNGDLIIDAVGRAEEAILRLSDQHYDCMILDLHLPDMTGFQLLEKLSGMEIPMKPPVVVYTGRDISREEYRQLERHAESIIIKGAKSPERLLDEVSLFLHRVEASFPAGSQALLQRRREEGDELKGRKILVVDDDMRNVFALVNALELSGIESVAARNGREALEKLRDDPGIELVLMDIMMPEMNGYEAIEKIRQDSQLRKKPVIALTAKAMREDQELCMKAGANDYLAKPVNLEQLLSLLKVWLPRAYD